MKKRTTLSGILLFAISLITTFVYAQPDTQALGIIGRIVNFFQSLLGIFFGDISAQSGQITVLKFLFFLVLAVGLYEVFSRLLGMRPLISGIIGVLVSAATLLLIPGSVLLALFSAAGSFVILLVLILLYVPPSILTWHLMKRKNWGINAGLIIGWVILVGLFTVSTARITQSSSWVLFLAFLYSFAVIVAIIAYTVTGSGARVATASGSYAKRIAGMAKEALIGETLTIEHDLEAHTNALRSRYTGMTTAANFKSGFGDKAVLELGKIAALLKVEKSKTTDAGIKSEIDIVVKAIEGTGGPFTGGIVLSGPPRGGILRWITYLNTNWGSATIVSVDGTNNLNTTAGKTAEMTQSSRGLIPALEQLEKYIKTINQQIAKSK